MDPQRWITEFEQYGLSCHEAGARFLAEFGGLAVNQEGPGLTSVREPFNHHPMECAGEEDRFLEWGEELGRSLFPVGILGDRQFFLGIDEYAVIYLVETWVASFGKMPSAIENLVHGVQPEELLTE